MTKIVLMLTILLTITAARPKKLSLFVDVLDALELLPQITDPKTLIKEEQTCSEAISNILSNLPNTGSLYYILVNGWYMSEWGDYSTCLGDATDAQYVFVTINGNYSGPALFTRGAVGKFQPFSAKVGLCVPKQCSYEDLKSMDSHFMTMGQNANWTDVTVDYYMASQADQAAKMSSGGYVILAFFLVMFLLGVVGTIIELSKIGDIQSLDYQRLNPLGKFKTVAQYEPILIQKKRSCAQKFLVLSALRNAMTLAKQPRAYRETRNNPDSNPVTKHLKVFNGIIGLAMVYLIFCHTYYFSWYGIVDNPFVLDEWKQSLLFTFIPGGFFVVPSLLFALGFVSTYSFLNRPAEKQFQIQTIAYYLFKKIARVIPYYAFILGFGTLILPSFGKGPIWNTYDKVMQGCSSYWWTNLVFINNFYPVNYDEKCMPWTWFIACYIQLSIALPLILAIYKYLSNMIAVIIYTVIFIFFIGINMEIIVMKDIGATPAFNDQFYAEVFMRPYFQFNNFFLGVIACLIYLKYVNETAEAGQINNSISSRLLNLIKKNSLIRYPCYILAQFLIMITMMGVYQYQIDPKNWNTATQAVYGSLAFTTFAFGVAIYTMCALIGRAGFINFFFGGDIWSYFKNLAFPLYLWHPLMFLFYYLSMCSDYHLGHQMMFYSFSGTLIFSIIVSSLLAIFIDRPFYNAFLINFDIKNAYHPAKDFDIDNYKIKEGVLLGEEERNQNSNGISPSSNGYSPSKREEEKSTLFDISETKNKIGDSTLM